MLKNKISNFFNNNKFLAVYISKNLCWFLLCWGILGGSFIYWITDALLIKNNIFSTSLLKTIDYFMIISLAFAIIWTIIILPPLIKWRIKYNQSQKTNYEWWNDSKQKTWIIKFNQFFGLIIFLFQIIFVTFFLIMPIFNFSNLLMAIFSLLIGIIGFIFNLIFFYFFYLKIDFKNLK